MNGRFAVRLAGLGAPLFTVVVSLLLAGCGVSAIPTSEEHAKAMWSEVLNQYQRRSDLIPNLVEVVKGYATPSRDVLATVIEARAKAAAINVDASTITDPEKFNQFQAAQAELGRAVERLIAVSDTYPDLKSSQNFLTLQSQIEGTENRIAVARRDYARAVQAYNTELKAFPGALWASTLYRAYKPMETFGPSDGPAPSPKAKSN
ncbi:LemA family protein [Xanthobacter sediminis]